MSTDTKRYLFTLFMSIAACAVSIHLPTEWFVKGDIKAVLSALAIALVVVFSRVYLYMGDPQLNALFRGMKSIPTRITSITSTTLKGFTRFICSDFFLSLLTVLICAGIGILLSYTV